MATNFDLIAFLSQDIQRYRDLVEKMYEDSRGNIMAENETLLALGTANARASTAQTIIEILNSSQSKEESIKRITREIEKYLYAPHATVASMQVFKAVMDKLCP